MVLFLKSIAHPPLFVKYFAHMQNRPAAKLTDGSRRPSSSQQFFFAKRFLRIIISSARRVSRCGRYNKMTPSVSLRSTAPPIPPQKNTASFFGGPGEGAKGINAALASQIMAQAGFPCARALNLYPQGIHAYLHLNLAERFLRQQKDFREIILAVSSQTPSQGPRRWGWYPSCCRR